MRVIPVAMAAVLAGGCVTPQAMIPPNTMVDFTQYNTVKLVMVDEVGTPYSQEGLPMFEAFLKGRLQYLGYSVGDENAALTLEVKVLTFAPGSKTTRLLVGFGAGRAVLTYLANFKDRSGVVIAQLEGGRSYHGMGLEDDAFTRTDEEIKLGMIREAAVQVGRFIRNNGELK